MSFKPENTKSYLLDDKYPINSISEIKKTLRITTHKEEAKQKIFDLCINDPLYLQKIIGNHLPFLCQLIEIYPNQCELLLTTTLQKTNYIHEVSPYEYNAEEDKQGNFLGLLYAFPNHQKLILDNIFRHESWLNYTIHGHLALWKLKKLALSFPGYEQVLCNTALQSDKIKSYLMPQLKTLQTNTEYQNLTPEAFLDKFLARHPSVFLSNVTIDRDELLLSLMTLFPDNAEMMFDRAVTNDNFLKSIKLAYSRVDTLDEIMQYLPMKTRTEIFEKLFKRPEAFIDILTNHCYASNGAPSFEDRIFDRFVELFPNNLDRMFEFMFIDNPHKLHVGIMKDVLNLIKLYPHAKEFFYERYLASEKEFNGYIINSQELYKLMKLYPDRELTLLKRAFTNETFISWRGFRTGYTSNEGYYQDYIAKKLHQNPELQDYIFKTTFGSEELMSKLISSRVPNDMIADLALLVKYFPKKSVEIFKLAFPNAEVLEHRLVTYDEFAPKLAKVFPNIAGICEGNVFYDNNEIQVIEDRNVVTEAPKGQVPSIANSLFSYFSQATHEIGSKIVDEIKHVRDVFAFKN